MVQSAVFNDWLFRYGYIYHYRLSDRSKRKFLKALVMDIAQIRKDIQVIEYDQQRKAVSRNVYVGDIATAKRVICTYYDTPPQHVGDYPFFDRQKQGRQTTRFISISTLVTIFIGLSVTWFYSQNTPKDLVFFSWPMFFIAFAFALYFIFLSRVTKGMLRQRNLTRNTSSVLALLLLIQNNARKDTAFAFIDEGSYGERGLEVLLDSTNEKATIFYLDSIGAKAPLHALGKGFDIEELTRLGITHGVSQKNKISYVFSGDQKENNHYYLSKKALRQKEMNTENLNKVIALFQ
ncbi:MAG: hypothetical protein ACI32O_07635 [Enterococcus sp.]